MVPGRALRRIAKFLLPAQVCDQIVDAQLADFQHEWLSAPHALARALVLARGYLAFCVVFVTCAVGMRGLEVDERRALRRVFAIAVLGTFVMTVGLAMAFTGGLHSPVHADPDRLLEFQHFRWVMFFNMASQVLALAGSVGLVCGIAMGLPRDASRTSRRVLLLAAVASSVVLFVMSSWILPPGFRALSQVIRGQPSAGQPAAATLGDTWRRMVATERTATAGPGTIRAAQIGYHFRWAWPFATFSLGLFALSLIHRGRVARIVLGIAGCAVYFYVVRNVTQTLVWESRLSPIVVAWWPNTLFVVLSIVIMAVSRPRAFGGGMRPTE